MTEQNLREWTKADCKKCLTWRSGNCNKGDFGYIALVGGSVRYGGAAKLANLAAVAMRGGAGVVKLAVPKDIATAVMPYLLESTLFPLSANSGELVFVKSEADELLHNVNTVAIGMGCGTGCGVKQTLQYLLSNFGGTLIIDADGLNCLSKDIALLNNCLPKVVLTPHVKEFSRLTGLSVENILADPVKTATRFAAEHGVIVLLKGATTTVTDGNNTLLVKRGCAGMATAGSGDVLSGLTAAICAYNGDNLTEAVATAAYVNGLAGEIAQSRSNPISMIASDTVQCIADAVTDVLTDV